MCLVCLRSLSDADREFLSRVTGDGMTFNEIALLPILHMINHETPLGVLLVVNKIPDLCSLLQNTTITEEDIRMLESTLLHVGSAVHATSMLEKATQVCNWGVGHLIY